MKDDDVDELSLYDLDPNRLDEQWVEQSRLMRVYTRRVADMRAEASRASAKVDVARAEVDRDLRSDPEKYGITKVTEALIDRMIVLDDRMRAAVEAEIEAQHALDIVKGAIDCLHHRKTGLEEALKMHMIGYSAEPRSPADKPEFRTVAEVTKKRIRSGFDKP